MQKDIKVTLGPSLAEKQSKITDLELKNQTLTNDLTETKLALSEMTEKCNTYADDLLDTRSQIANLAFLME